MNEELKAINDLAADFAKAELAAHTIEHEFPYARPVTGLIHRAAETGLFGVTLPGEWGGIGLDAAALASMVQTISEVDAGLAAMLVTHAAALEVVAAAAEADAAGGRTAYERLTNAGGAALAFQSYAAPDETELAIVTGAGEPVLSGKLGLVVLGGFARFAVVPAARAGERRYSYYLLDLAGAGVTKSSPVLTLGLQAAQAVDVTLTNAPAMLLGAEGQGEVYFRRMQAQMSLPAAALSLGILDGSFKAAVDYGRQRSQGLRNIIDWSGVRMKLAEMAVQVEIGRGLLRGLETAQAPRAGVAAALHVSELACNGTVEGVQLLGGNGYMKDYGQEKRMRDARQARSLFGMAAQKKLKIMETLLEETLV